MTTQPQLPMFDPLQALLREHADQFRPEFPAWLRENGQVWRSFKREADRIWHRGRRHYSSRTIIEHLRHESAITSNDVEFKLNNNVAPDLARLYRLAHPDRAELFETRLMPGSRRAA